MAVNLSPVGGVAAQFFTNSGAVLTGGKLYTYAAGTTTPQASYTTSQGNVPWTNPIVLDAAGRVPSGGEIWITDGLIYKFVLKDSNDVVIATYDNISGINSNFVAYTNSQEIQTATAGQTVFTLTTMAYLPGTNSLSVFVDGVNQYGPGAQYSYVETDSTTVTFASGLHKDAQVKFTTTQQQGAGAVDASQVTYDPPFTGSIATNVEAKLAQTVSVKDFGAVGDGVADDTAAIQSAIDSSNSPYLVFPKGEYLVTGLTATSKTNIQLQSYGAKLKLKATVGTGISVAPVLSFDQCTNVVVDGFEINGNKANQKNLVEAQRGDGAAILTNKCVNIAITNNHIYDNTAGAAILCSQGGAEGGAGVVVSNYCLIDNNIIESCGQRPVGPTIAASDAIFCNQNNAVISNNKLYDFTDVGIAHDFSRNQQILNNFIDGQGNGIQGIACYGSFYVDVIGNIVQTVGRGIIYSDQGNPAYSCQRFNIAFNDLRGIKNPDVPGGNDDCISVIQSASSAYFKIIGNTCGGGDNSIVVVGTYIHVEDNDCFSPLDRPLSATGQYLTIRDNRFAATNPAYINSAKNSLVDVRGNTTSFDRLFSASITNPSYARLCYIKTDSVSGIRACLVEMQVVTSTGLVSTQTWKIVANSGTVTATSLSSSGDTTGIEQAISQNGVSRVEVLIRPASGSFDFSASVSVMCPQQTDTFYIDEA